MRSYYMKAQVLWLKESYVRDLESHQVRMNPAQAHMPYHIQPPLANLPPHVDFRFANGTWQAGSPVYWSKGTDNVRRIRELVQMEVNVNCRDRVQEHQSPNGLVGSTYVSVECFETAFCKLQKRIEYAYVAKNALGVYTIRIDRLFSA